LGSRRALTERLIEGLRNPDGELLVCGILNVTPDSFSDGGRHYDLASAISHARNLAMAGADLIDIGGESTRPGARVPSLNDELERVVPVVQALAYNLDVPLSVDSSQPEVMEAAVSAGASMINDVRALERPGALDVAARLDVAVCLMHMRGDPQTMQEEPRYDDVVEEVHAYLAERRDAALAAGVGADRLILDPGFGFGKNLRHNVELLRSLDAFADLGCPLMVGVSRKSMIGELTGRVVSHRLAGSVAAAALAVQAGARIVRVHDVAETRDAVAVVHGLRML
jgi:dihydropteroate synthase